MSQADRQKSFQFTLSIFLPQVSEGSRGRQQDSNCKEEKRSGPRPGVLPESLARG